MKPLAQNPRRTASLRQAGMTLVEVAVAMAITGLAVGGIITGYIYCTTTAEKSAISLAATSRALERVEEMRGAKWDMASWPVVDRLVATNFPNKSVILDLSGSGGSRTTGTLVTAISQISTTPPLKRLRVDCIWTFKGKSVTNTIETCRAPDQ